MSASPALGIADGFPEPSPFQAASPWWLIRVDAYRFLIRGRDVAAVREDLAPAAVAHLPAWVAGLVHVQGHLLGVLDLGRFLGVCTVRPGPVILPVDGLRASWAVRVHAVEAAPIQAEPVALSVAQPPTESATRRSIDARPRPAFAGERWTWVDAQGQRIEADELVLSELIRHPRLREQG